MGTLFLGLAVLVLGGGTGVPATETAGGLKVVKPSRGQPVDFQKEILPVFQKNCLACHNRTKAKADLVLETPAEILKGGESGPGVVPGKARESLVFKLSVHADKPVMPPKDNKVEAVNLTPEELGVLEAWINEGAKGEVRQASSVAWQPLSEKIQPIYSLALTMDGEWAACGRGNRLFVYHLPTRQLDSQLTRDPGTSAPAHIDLVHSVDFSPDGRRLASGDYGRVHLWRLEETNRVSTGRDFGGKVRFVSRSQSGIEWMIGLENERAVLWNRSQDVLQGAWDAAWSGVVAGALSGTGKRAVTVHTNLVLRWWDVGTSKLEGETTLPQEAGWVALSSRGDVAIAGGAQRGWMSFRWAMVTGGVGRVEMLPGPGGVGARIIAARAVPGDGALFMLAGDDAKIRIWEAGKAEIRHTLSMGAGIVTLEVSPDGTRAGVALEDGSVKLVRVEDASILADLRDNRDQKLQEEALERRVTWAKADVDFRKATLEEAKKREKAETEFLGRSQEERLKAEKAYGEKQKALIAALEAKAAAQKVPAETAAELVQVKGKLAELEAPLTAARKEVEDSKQRLKSAEEALDQLQKGVASAPTPEAKVLLEKWVADARKVVEWGKSLQARGDSDLATRVKAWEESRLPWTKKLQELTEREKGLPAKLEAAGKAVEQSQKEAEDALGLKRTMENQVASAERAARKASELVPQSEEQLKGAETVRGERQKELDVVLKAAVTAAPIRHLAFLGQGKVLAGLAGEQRVVQWSAEDGRVMAPLTGPALGSDGVAAMAAGAWSRHGASSALVVIHASGRQTVWVPERRWVWERALGEEGTLAGRVNAVKFSRDGKQLATGAGEPTRNGDLKLWNVEDGRLARVWTNAHSDIVLGLDFSPDGKQLASSGADRFARVWSLSDGRLERTLEGHTHHVMNVSWRPDGRTLASAGADKVIKIWNVMTGEQRRTLSGASKEVTSVRFLESNGDLLASSADGLMRWMNDEGKMVRSFEGASDYVQAGAVTPNGKVVVAGGDKGNLWFWDGASGKLVTTFAPSPVPAP